MASHVWNAWKISDFFWLIWIVKDLLGITCVECTEEDKLMCFIILTNTDLKIVKDLLGIPCVKCMEEDQLTIWLIRIVKDLLGIPCVKCTEDRWIFVFLTYDIWIVKDLLGIPCVKCMEDRWIFCSIASRSSCRRNSRSSWNSRRSRRTFWPENKTNN